jgi:tetratricopeptide (TPR) repeat protein
VKDRFTQNPAAHDLWVKGNELFDQGRAGSAAEKFDEAVRLDPSFAEAWNSLGLVSYERRDYARAAEMHKRAVLVKPDFVEALSNLGTDFLFLGRFPDAAAAFEKVLVLQPDMPEAHNNLGLVYEQLRRTREAVACYRRFIELWKGGRRFALAAQERIDRLEKGKVSGFGEPP